MRERFVTQREIVAGWPDLRLGVGVTAALASRGVYPVIDSRWVNPIFDRAAVEVALGAMPARHLRERRGNGRTT